MKPETPKLESVPEIAIDGMRFAYAEGSFGITVPELRVASGDRIALIGPSGSGKTTLLQLISGALKPLAGKVLIGDFDMGAADDLASRSFRLRNMGMVFQEFELLEALTVRENVLLPFLLEPEIGEAADFEDELVRLAEGVGIGRYLDRKPRRLSQGERQRVAICRALVTRPPIILADEPTGNLDPATREVILEVIESEIARIGATLIAVTHDHGILGRFDRVIDFADFLETV